ncbi:dipeptidase [Williamsia maris]|uniref:Membrane dipeptidase n=1 Tax=Williamsia maris TaxID=72806 RepID=A0ABT1HJH6_9NOCA|nr:membrane dipeptidase [Williamsia maris]MCP2178101.1 membrane dipeptidase [Williamsia maris]
MSRTRPWTPTPEQLVAAHQLVLQSYVVDLHAHPQGIMPRPVRWAAEKLTGLPVDPLSNLPTAGVDLAVVAAIGDPLGTAWRVGSSPWKAVTTQLNAAITESTASGTAATPPESPSPTIVLAVEGADFLDRDLDGLARLAHHGVRVLGLVHYANNAIGSIGTSLSGRRRQQAQGNGLTAFGRDVIREANHLGIVIDLAHADTATTLAACQQTDAPVISSHTAASSIRDFPRYISDDEIKAIADTGGIIGLWPASMHGRAMTDLDDFARHATHMAELVGTGHLAIGTDKNGVPDYAHGYSGSPDIVNLAAALTRTGFADTETAAILGGNAQRVLDSRA